MPTPLEQAQKLGLTADEYAMIVEQLGRTPNFNEICVYSVMWSEHCSYKNSIKWLKTLPKKGEHILVEAGEENAGLIDIGNGYACSFKIESHNHPSAIEPFQGAATGVGGIHRDIFTMGARPIAALNSLRFGDIQNPKTKHLLKGVVAGIGHYGNCFGVPTVGGEIYFEDCYQTNPLVNAMSVGVVHKDNTISATSYGVGNPVFIVGSDTGKDGIGGASFASADINEESAKQLPAVQVGDPFQEKKLMEACMELTGKDYIIGMQDMGAAGISCSSSEMSAKGNHGMNIWLDKVPTRQANMLPWEMLLSESQERMLLVIKKGFEKEIQSIFDKWDVHCVQIGEVTEGGQLNYFMHDELVASIPAQSLVLGGGAPVYDREYVEPQYFENIKSYNIDQVADTTDALGDTKSLITRPNIASKKWIYEQYDSMVGTANTSSNSPSDAAVVWVKETGKCLALTVDCNARYVHNDPYQGGMIAVSEAARNIVCSGGHPAAITNCLNFGNPYNPEVYYQFVYALKGMSTACETLGTPVTGGNVSFYNQWEKGPVYPTPTIGMVGVMDTIYNRMTLDYKSVGDIIYLVGEEHNDISSSEYLSHIKGIELSPAPYFVMAQEAKLQNKILELINSNAIQSAHDISDGGLIITLLEKGFHRNLGFTLERNDSLRMDAQLFGEAQSRVVVSVAPNRESQFLKTLGDMPYRRLGTVTDGSITVAGQVWPQIQEWKSTYDNHIGHEMKGVNSEL